MHQKQLELLKVLRDATRNGRAAWKRDGGASHHTELAGLQCSLRFKHPLLAGDDGSDADAVEVTAGRTVWTFYSGTEGFDLVSEILTAAYPEVREHNQQAVAQLEATMEKIRKNERTQAKSVERTGMSRSAQSLLQRPWRLIPVAHLHVRRQWAQARARYGY